MPVVGRRVSRRADFSNYFVPRSAGQTATTLAEGARGRVPLFAYGNFITMAINFVILAFIIFVMVKQINRLKRRAAAPPPPPPPEDGTCCCARSATR